MSSFLSALRFCFEARYKNTNTHDVFLLRLFYSRIHIVCDEMENSSLCDEI